MTFLEILKKIFPINIKLPEHISLIHIGKLDNSKKIIHNDSSKTIVNLNSLSKEEEQGLKEILPLALKENYTLLTEDTKLKAEDFKKESGSVEAKEILAFLRPKISAEEINIWRAALYLRSKHNTGRREEVKKLKYEIMQKYGEKGRNIANLCSENYVKDFLIPLYNAFKQFHKDVNLATEKFRVAYELIVNELPFTIFVNYRMSVDDIKLEIEKRKRYGSKFINIHGIGEDNKDKIQQVAEELKDTGKYEMSKYSKEENVVLVTVRPIEDSV
ncbi:MAG: hypothetical protein ABIH08_01430 [Candidatus Omnitrophota bacterium]